MTNIQETIFNFAKLNVKLVENLLFVLPRLSA